MITPCTRSHHHQTEQHSKCQEQVSQHTASSFLFIVAVLVVHQIFKLCAVGRQLAVELFTAGNRGYSTIHWCIQHRGKGLQLGALGLIMDSLFLILTPSLDTLTLYLSANFLVKVTSTCSSRVNCSSLSLSSSPTTLFREQQIACTGSRQKLGSSW